MASETGAWREAELRRGSARFVEWSIEDDQRPNLVRVPLRASVAP